MANPVTIGASGDNHLYQGRISAQEGVGSFLDFTLNGAYGSAMRIKRLDVLSAALSGATANVGTNSISAGWLVLGVLIRVTTLITASGGGVSFTVGDGTVADRWGAAIAFAANTVTTGTAFKAATAAYQMYPAAANLVLTVNAGAFTAGVVRAAIYYIDFTSILA